MADDPSNPEPPLDMQGMLLLADPTLRDSIFQRSVILLTEKKEGEGAFGLILNHPTGKTVGDFLKGDDFAPLKQLAVHEGGPVARDQLTFSSFWWSKNQGLRWALRLSAEDAVKHTRRPGRIVRAFVGYSGWSAGQLEDEFRRGLWIPSFAHRELLWKDHDIGLWAAFIALQAPIYRILASAPDDPSLN